MKLRFLPLALLALSQIVVAQDRLQTMPRFDRYQKMRGEIGSSVKRASLSVRWAADGKAFWYEKDGKTYKFDIATLKEAEVAADTMPPAPATPQRPADPNRGRPRPERGRQYAYTISPDGQMRAQYKDRNVWIGKADGTDLVQVTTVGDAAKRTKAGQASWVYGEEFFIPEAMWWAPDGKKLAYYVFDDSKVKDYYLAMKVTAIQTEMDIEAYPKAGADNPKVELWVYDVASKKHTKFDTEFGDATLGHYVYQVRWSPDGKELLYHRTNRKQNVMEFCAGDPTTGKGRVVVRESHPNSWADNSPFIRWMDTKPGQFIWISERNGYANYYLGNISGAPLKPITQHPFEVAQILRLEEDKGLMYYTARDGSDPYKVQVHRIKLDGTGHQRMTSPDFHHSVDLSPTGEHLIDTAETINTPPTVRLTDATGKVLATLATSDDTKFKALGLQKVERFKFKAADGVTDCYGTLMKPSDFDPSKKYPVLVSVYAGPESGGGADRFQLPQATAELGFLTVWIDGRGTNNRGKAFKDAVYGKLGVVEIDDQAAGVKALRNRPYVDGSKVGIYGTSYGGYASAMAILRHPDVFQAAVANSSVTDWRNYDTIYTERYMGLPWDNENKKGYDEGSAMKYAANLKGRLLLFYGTADNNVHPANSYQLARALQSANKSFFMMAGPDEGHSAVDMAYTLEFFIEFLILRP